LYDTRTHNKGNADAVAASFIIDSPPDAESEFFEHPRGAGLATLEVCGAELLARWIRSRVKVGSLHHAALLGTDNPYDILLQ